MTKQVFDQIAEGLQEALAVARSPSVELEGKVTGLGSSGRIMFELADGSFLAVKVDRWSLAFLESMLGSLLTPQDRSNRPDYPGPDPRA